MVVEGVGKMNMKCPICGKTEFENNYDRCEFCEWMNDYYQMIHPNRTGVNPVSLNQAKKNFKIRTRRRRRK